MKNIHKYAFHLLVFSWASSERIAYVPFASCLHLSEGQIWDPINNWGSAFCGDS